MRPCAHPNPGCDLDSPRNAGAEPSDGVAAVVCVPPSRATRRPADGSSRYGRTTSQWAGNHPPCYLGALSSFPGMASFPALGWRGPGTSGRSCGGRKAVPAEREWPTIGKRTPQMRPGPETRHPAPSSRRRANSMGVLRLRARPERSWPCGTACATLTRRWPGGRAAEAGSANVTTAMRRVCPGTRTAWQAAVPRADRAAPRPAAGQRPPLRRADPAGSRWWTGAR